ncbi:uncharacterized protein LOC126831861 isoform X2 [Patella vulgata]|uniref:uncharacterized protein LOC126831861 isoform X2 n=1 Tax=Patella vulgata TaxID=6465 RepID=UPI0024A81AC2|nr:uncharacterized protein LOC126831861 isoform X2 [Patella vulgata]
MVTLADLMMLFTVKSSSAFALWTLTSFLCHWTAKRYLATLWEGDELIYASIITTVQCFTCFVFVDIIPKTDVKSSIVKIVAHILATFCTNYSMAYMNAASTFTIKLLEPITSAVAQSLFQETLIPLSSLISLPLIIYGALLFTGSSLGDIVISPGILLAFMSNTILAARNIAILTEHKTNSESRLRNWKGGFLYVASVLIALDITERTGVLSKSEVQLVLLVVGSGIFHVGYSYISTHVILKTMTVFNHSVLNICKRLFVVILLYVGGGRRASGRNWLGLLVCSVGLVVHVLDKSTKRDHRMEQVSSKRNGLVKTIAYCMIPLLLFGSITITSILNLNRSVFVFNYTLHNPTHLEMKAYDKRSPLLKTSDEIIQEAQRIHYDLFTELLKPYKNVMLFDIALHENKGDPAITIGEMILLQRLNKTLVYYCDFYRCKNNKLKDALSIIKDYSPQNLAILLHGGGNLVGWIANDKLREKILNAFRGFQFVLFPQSIFMSGGENQLKHCENLYRRETNLTMILRDRNTARLARKHFAGQPKLIMAPDMAFEIGPVRRFIKPFYDILWIRRTDQEQIDDQIPSLPADLQIRIEDWLSWSTARSNINMENAYLIANHGLLFLQRGRVVITDRLHGHILSILLDIPHVILNNKWNKVSNYHNTWTKSLRNTRVADNGFHAIELAKQLLVEYSDVLPEKVPFMTVEDHIHSD